VSAVQDVKVK